MLRLDFSGADLNLPATRDKTRRASVSGVQDDYVLPPAYDLLNTSVHFPNEPTATGLDFFADGHFTSAYETLGLYSSSDFIELGRAFGVAEDEVLGQLAMFAERRVAVEKMLDESALSNEAKTRYLFRFHDRLRAIAQ